MCDWKKIFIGGIAGGILLTIVSFIAGWVLNLFIPFGWATIQGIRSINDPIMALYFAYPLVISFAAAFVFDRLHEAKWTQKKGSAKGIYFGGILFLLETIPNQFLVFTTMNYPNAFYVHNIIGSAIGYALLGILFTKIWKEK